MILPLDLLNLLVLLAMALWSSVKTGYLVSFSFRHIFGIERIFFWTPGQIIFKSQVTLGQGNLSKLYLVASSLIVLWYLERKKCSQWQQIKTWNLERMDPLKWLNSWVPKQTITCFSMLKQFFGIISIIEWLSLLSRVLFIPSKVGKHSDPLSPDQVKMRDL